MRYFALLFILFAWTSEAWACSCAGPRAIEHEFKESIAIFSSHTQDFEKDKNGHPKKITLYVDRVWKGDIPKTHEIDFSQLRSGCAYWGFEENTHYLIYAHEAWDKNNPGGLQISSCSRTKRLENAQIETRYLDAIVSKGDIREIDLSLPGILTNGAVPHMRTEAAHLLGWMMLHDVESVPEGTVAAFTKAAQSAEDSVKLAVAQNLGRHTFRGRPGVTDALLKLLNDGDPEISSAAASSLGLVGRGDARTFQALVKALHSIEQKQPVNDKRHETTLTTLGTAIAKVAKTDEEKGEAANILHSLIDQIHDPYSKVSIIQHLGFQKEHAQHFFPKLLQVLKGADHDHLKQYTISALGDIKATEALETIKPYLKDGNCYVVKSTVEAVSKIDPSGFSGFFENQAMPEIKARYTECAHQMVWMLQSIGTAAKGLEPFLIEKYEAMPSDDWKRGSLKTLLDSWRRTE